MSWEAARESLQKGLSHVLEPPRVESLVERLVSFFPLAIVLCWKVGNRRWRRGPLAAFSMMTGIVVAMEGLQCLVPLRHPKPAEAMLGVCVSALGVFLGATLHRHRARLRRYVLAHARTLAALFLMAGNAAAATVLVAAHEGASIAGWDPAYPLLVANERTGDRPWRGRIRGLALYDRQLTPHEVSALRRVPMAPERTGPRLGADPIALYFFDAAAGGRVRQRATGGPSLDLLLPGPSQETRTSADGGIEIRESIVIESDGAATRLSEAIGRSKAFTVEFEIAPRDLTQRGPARIVSVSFDPSHRNFTIGQVRGAVEVRIRTAATGPNGRAVLSRSGHVLRAGQWQHVAVSHFHGATRIYVDGVKVAGPIRIHSVSARFLGSDAAGSDAIIMGVLFFAAGAATAPLFSRHRPLAAAALAVCATALVPLALSVATAAHFGREQDLYLLSAAVAAPALGAAIGRTVHRALRSDPTLSSETPDGRPRG